MDAVDDVQKVANESTVKKEVMAEIEVKNVIV